MNKLLLIFIISCNTAFAQGNLVFAGPMHFTSNASIQPNQVKICFDTISIPSGHVLKLESHFMAESRFVNSTSVLIVTPNEGYIIEATATIPNKGIILGSVSTTGIQNGNFPMWLSAGTYYIYIHKANLTYPFYGRYSLHGILFSIN